MGVGPAVGAQGPASDWPSLGRAGWRWVGLSRGWRGGEGWGFALHREPAGFSEGSGAGVGERGTKDHAKLGGTGWVAVASFSGLREGDEEQVWGQEGQRVRSVVAMLNERCVLDIGKAIARVSLDLAGKFGAEGNRNRGKRSRTSQSQEMTQWRGGRVHNFIRAPGSSYA